MAGCVTVTKAVTVAEFLVRKRGLEPLSLAALAPKASVFAISPLPHIGKDEFHAGGLLNACQFKFRASSEPVATGGCIG
jgi:hypothetical protein